MIEALISGFGNLLTWAVFPYMCLGIVIGLTFGLLPGLGGVVGLAIVLPFTFALDPLQAFALLIGLAAVTSTASDITAILFGVPGEPTSAALVLDGHALTRKGQAGVALGASLASSVFGALLGAAILAIIVPMVRPIVLAFASPELFMLTVLGLTFIGSLSGSGPLKGLISAAIGVMLSMVGVDRQSAISRYTFGLLPLWDGLGLVAVTLGLFGVPAVVELAVKKPYDRSSNEHARMDAQQIRQGLQMAFRRFSLLLRGSIIGAFVGLLPGLGGAVAQWLAYGHAAQTTREPTQFGTGNIDGVIAPGAANNAKEGGSLVPVLAFGVPGSVATAVLLGAFLIHGLVPGQEMLSTHLSLTMSFIWIVALSGVIAGILCFLGLRLLIASTRIQPAILVPLMLWLIMIGAYSERGAIADLAIVLVFGLVGFAMAYLEWSRPALLLGLVLGSLMEGYLFITVDRYGVQWFGRPIVILIGVLAIGVIAHTVFRATHLTRQQSGSAGDRSSG